MRKPKGDKDRVTGDEVNERVSLILKAFQVAQLEIPADFTSDVALTALGLHSMLGHGVPMDSVEQCVRDIINDYFSPDKEIISPVTNVPPLTPKKKRGETLH